MDEESPMFMFPPDTLVERMEQVRKIVADMGQYEVSGPEWILLAEATNLLLTSCKIGDTPDRPKYNLHKIH